MNADWKYELILEQIDPDAEGHPEATKEELTEALWRFMEGDVIRTVSSADQDCFMAYFPRDTAIEIHVFSRCKSPWRLKKLAKITEDYLFSRYVNCDRLETRTQKGFARLLENNGWINHGLNNRYGRKAYSLTRYREQL